VVWIGEFICYASSALNLLLSCLGYVHGGLDAWVRSVYGLGLRMGSS
jgi:uncharacterized membrane protein YqaE (UPF0057 family)